MQPEQLYKQFARTLGAYQNCVKSNIQYWQERHLDTIKRLNEQLPHGSGLDHSTNLIIKESTPERLVFGADYHHMNEGGMYDGWTDHKVIIIPSLQFDFVVKVTGRNRDDIKDYITEMFQYALSQTLE